LCLLYIGAFNFTHYNKLPLSVILKWKTAAADEIHFKCPDYLLLPINVLEIYGRSVQKYSSILSVSVICEVNNIITR
jgi:hypothetical protein